MPATANYNEENMAILIADLAGYTALTETHGAAGAADMIDTYLDIVKESLVGDSYLHEYTGDEVMIVSACANQLLHTAQNLVEASSRKNNFLQVHGGLHYGKILKRNSRFFGTTINLAARIAAKANAGTVWCSQDFINAVDDKNAHRFVAKGKYFFKNISQASQVYELTGGDGDSTPPQVDPVCKMLVSESEKAIQHPFHKQLLFCDRTCLDIYLSNAVN
jgi:class 3 adenylate cyclase